jgi:MoaA/NifB/PqqE/SkfB family radical SAM enzyme
MLYRELTLATNNKLLPCCLFTEDIEIKDSVEKTFLEGEFETLRKKMLAGEKISACEQCYKKEEIGLESLRLQSNKKWNNPSDVKLKVLEIEFDNVCNLKCRSCNSVHSHLWYNDEKRIFGTTMLPKKYRQVNDYLSLDLSNVETIKFYGGEPFYSPRCKDFCKHLANTVDLSNLNIVTFSNCTVLPNNDILKVLNKCMSLNLILSIDGFENFNEYFRSGSSWNKVVESLDFYTELANKRKNTSISINTTVNIYNANLLDKLDQFITLNYPLIKLEKNVLTYPEYLSIANLPKEYKLKLEPYLQNYQNLLTFMNNDGNTKMFDYFLYFHHSLDKLRNEKLENDLLNSFIKDYKSDITKENMESLIKSYVSN